MKKSNKRSHPILIALLWILFFPIMCSVAICRSERLTLSSKILSTAAIWVILFSLIAAYGSNESTNNANDASKETSDTSEVNETTDDESYTDDNKTVYVTPSGKKYHLSAKCAGENAIEKKLSEVKSTHAPCKTCAKDIETSVTLTTTPEDTTTIPEETTTPKETTSPEQTTVPDSDKNSITVYITPNGKRYHHSEACAGKNATPVTLSEAEKKGLTLCNTCKNKK